MIKITLIGNRKSESVVDENSTIREVLAKNNLLQPGRSYSLNLREIPSNNLDSTFSDYGIEDGQRCTLTSIAQKNNA